MPTDSIDPHNRSLATTLSKLGVCKAINAVALIDDALEHALAFAVSDPPIPVLLFGDGPWNRRVSRAHYVVDGVDVGQMSFEQRYDYEGRTEFWKRDERAAMGTPVIRVKDWGEVVKWFEERFPEKVVQGP